MYAFKSNNVWVEHINQRLPLNGEEGLYWVPREWSDQEKFERFNLYLVAQDPVPVGKRATAWTLTDRAGAPVLIPTLVDIPPVDWDAIDQQQLNEALIDEGSVVRALGLIMFEEINKLRVRAGLVAYTMDQFKTALHNKMRDR